MLLCSMARDSPERLRGRFPTRLERGNLPSKCADGSKVGVQLVRSRQGQARCSGYRQDQGLSASLRPGGCDRYKNDLGEIASLPHPALRCSAMYTPAAERIPQELFAYIIGHLYSRIDYLPDRYDVRRTGLLSGSLVCVHWAQQCREMLYRGRTIEIRSRKQAVGFRRMVMTESCKSFTPFAQMIARVDVDVDDRDERPWLHIIGALVPRLPHVIFEICNIGSGPLGFRSPFRSPLEALPKTLPGSFTPYRTLHLDGLRFRSLDDLLRLVSHFPRLEYLNLLSIKWKSNGTRTPARLQMAPVVDAYRCSLRLVRIENCTDDLLLWQCLMWSSRQSITLRLLSPEDQAAVCHIVACVYDAAAASQETTPAPTPLAPTMPTPASRETRSKTDIILREVTEDYGKYDLDLT